MVETDVDKTELVNVVVDDVVTTGKDNVLEDTPRLV